MDEKAPLNQFLTGVKAHYDIPKKCKKILQVLIMEIENGKCLNGLKLKIFDNSETIITKAWKEFI
jgi:hypothetical protein